MSKLTRLLIINILLLCSLSRTISPVDCNDRSIRSGSNVASEKHGQCREFFYTCLDKTCIPKEKFCDMHVDCEDGSDEYLDCTQNKTCMDYEFKCDNGYCVYNNKRCDGNKDCLDNSDESNCAMNRCEYNGQLCDQICTDITDSTYQCSCAKEYNLQADNKTCKLADDQSETLLVYAKNNSIGALKLPSIMEIELVTNLNRILAVTVDALHVYWSVEIPEESAIFRSIRDKNQPQAIVTTGLGYIEEIAIDWVTTNIYFVDGIRRKIGICSNNGSYCTTILRGNLTNPNGIALHPFNGMMYWSDYGRKNGYIGKATMDGKNRDMLVSKDIGMPQALTIDVPNERLYWVDQRSGHVGSIRLNGESRQRIMSTETLKAQSIAIFEDRLYWTNYFTDTIESCNKFTGDDQKILRSNVGEVRGMHIYHELLKPNISNPCNSSGCMELCLLAGNDSYTCACSLDKKLSEDGHTCELLSGQQYLMIITNSIYFNYYGEFIGRPSIKRNKLFQHFNAIAYDSLNSSIFINDLHLSTIFRYDKETDKIQQLTGIKNQQIGGMSFDHIGNNLYWSNIRRNTIEVYSLETEQRTTLHFPMTPKNILVIPEFATMVVVFCINSTCQLDKLSMDGLGSITNLVSSELSGSRISLAYDNDSKRIFWADQTNGTIESIAMNGSNRTLLHSELLEPVSLAILEDDIYWTLYNSTTLYNSKKMAKRSNSATYRIPFPLVNKTEIVHLMLTNDHNNRSEHECSTNNGGCSHVCLIASMNSSRCACPNGLILNSDKHTCESQKECTQNEFKCSDNSCIIDKKVCDGNEDCPDLDDEANCTLKRNNCPNNDFQCFNSKCISKYYMCDGKNDCGDWSDEMNCAHRMCADKTDFKCLSSGLCIPKSWQCDGQRDCDDGSDESGSCTKLACPPEMDPCSNGMCIHHSLQCNNVDDCGDNSDEVDCALYEHAGPLSDHHCDIDEYRCFGTDKCIPKNFRCNRYHDCPKNDDEHYCSTCSHDQFTCNNFNCIPKERVCDKYSDCVDNSDEEFCDEHGINHDETNLPLLKHFNNSMQNKEKFVCNNGDALDYGKVCDGNNDCLDNSDENGDCTSECSINLCEQRCERTPKGPLCLCMDGYKLKADNSTCEDIDECNLGMCSQVCHNVVGSFRCDCIAGYSLRYDQRTCKIIDGSMEIFSATTYDIRRITNNLREIDVVQKIENTVTGMDINVDKNLLYWSNEQLGTITEYDLMEKKRRIISNIGKPNLIAIDWITSNIYFFNNEKPYSIMACSRFNNSCATIVKLEDSGDIMSMTVDPIHGSIYWAQIIFTSNENPMSKIYRSDMNGDNIRIIAHEKIGIVSGIAVDYDRSQLFWIDASQGLIMKSGLDGTNRTVFRRVYQPLGLNVYQDSIYWMMSSTRILYSCPLHEKFECQPIAVKPTNIKDFLIISHTSRQPSALNTCEDKNCGWMCVINDKNATCICRDGDVLNSDGTCPNNEINSTVIDKNNLEFSAKDKKNHQNNSHVVAVIIGTLGIFVVGTACYFYRRRIFKKCQSYKEASVSFHNSSFGHKELNDDASLPIIASGSHEFTNPLSVENTSPASPRSETELVQLHLSDFHTANSSSSEKSDDEAN